MTTIEMLLLLFNREEEIVPKCTELDSNSPVFKPQILSVLPHGFQALLPLVIKECCSEEKGPIL